MVSIQACDKKSKLMPVLMRSMQFTSCVNGLYIYTAVGLDVNTPEAGPRVVPGALAGVLLAAGPAASHRWVCLALPVYYYF